MMNSARLKLKVIAVILGSVFLLQSSQGFSANTECDAAIKNLDLSETPTLDPQSIDQKIQNLSELKLSLDLAKVSGASPIEVAAMNEHYKTKEGELSDYLVRHNLMTHEQLIEKIKQQIGIAQDRNNINQESHKEDQKEEAKIKKEQEKQIKGSVIDGTRAIFHHVTPDKFLMGEVQNRVKVKLTKMPAVMATSMTQIIYKKVAELANLSFPDRVPIDSDPSAFKGDTRPVERVSYNDINKWVKALNDLSDTDPLKLKKIIPGHKKGMRYEGFMTEAQREYLMKKAKTEEGETIDELIEKGDFQKLNEYIVFFQPSTEVVNKVKPLLIDGNEFYGLHGNVWEWVKDWHREKLEGGVDPQGPKRSTGSRVVRGGCYYSGKGVLSSVKRISHPPDSRREEVGFRLVRIVE